MNEQYNARRHVITEWQFQLIAKYECPMAELYQDMVSFVNGFSNANVFRIASFHLVSVSSKRRSKKRTSGAFAFWTGSVR